MTVEQFWDKWAVDNYPLWNQIGLADIARRFAKDFSESRLAELERERDLAVAHDRQPYPTAEAYEAVCAARNKWQTHAEAAESQVAVMRNALKAVESLVEFYSQREMNSPSNGEQAVREARETLRIFRDALTPSPESTEEKKA